MSQPTEFDTLFNTSGDEQELRLDLPSSTIRLLYDSEVVPVELRRRLVPFVRVEDRFVERPDATIIARTRPSSTIALPAGAYETVPITSARLDRYRRHGKQARFGRYLATLNLQTGTRYVTDLHSNTIGLSGTDDVGVSKDVRRLIRAMFIADLKRTDHAFVHGGAVVVDGRAILIIGRKGAGKSSAVFEILRIAGTRFLANDSVFVQMDGDVLRARGVPEHLLVRIGLLGEMRELRPWLPEKFKHLSSDELWNVPDTEKISIQYRDVVEIFGTSVEPVATVACVIVPDYALATRGNALERISSDAAAAVIRDSYEEAPEHTTRPWYGIGDIDLARVAQTQRLLETALACRCPAYRLHRTPTRHIALRELVEQCRG